MPALKFEIKRKCEVFGSIFVAKTLDSISKKYRVDDSTVWAHIRKYSIPTRQIGNYVYAPKKEIDSASMSILFSRISVPSSVVVWLQSY